MGRAAESSLRSGTVDAQAPLAPSSQLRCCPPPVNHWTPDSTKLARYLVLTQILDLNFISKEHLSQPLDSHQSLNHFACCQIGQIFNFHIQRAPQLSLPLDLVLCDFGMCFPIAISCGCLLGGDSLKKKNSLQPLNSLKCLPVSQTRNQNS